jgi:hypothetical protein
MKMGTSDYKNLAEKMEADAFHKGCDISVLVEDIYDERFWECLIEQVKPNLKNKIDFPYSTPTGTRGKNILENFKDFVNKNLIICIDSDCEYLHNNNVWYLSEYIYNTFVYSRENFQCNHIVLNEISKDLTSKRYDFKALLENISLKILPLFYLWIHFNEIQYHQFNHIINQKEAFKKVLDFQNIEFENIGDENILYKNIEDRVNNVLQNLKKSMGDTWYDSILEEEVPIIKKRLFQDNLIREEDILSFCYGHAVLEKFIEPFMTKIIKILKNLRIEEVKKELSKAPKQVVDDAIARVKNNAEQDIKTKLNDGFKYLIYGTTENQEIQKIQSKLTKELRSN